MSNETHLRAAGTRRSFAKSSLVFLASLTLSVGGLLTACGDNDDDSNNGRWLSSWAASHNLREAPANLANSTVRMIVRPTAAGSQLRVKVENTLGTGPVTFSAAYVGIVDRGAAVVPGTNTRLQFGGRDSLTLAPGAGAWSDAVAFDVRAFQRLAVSLDVASATDASTHSLGLTTNFIASGGRASSVADAGFAPVPPMAAGTSVLAFPVYWVAAVDVLSQQPATIVALGDSITDGRCSTTTNGGIVGNGVVVPDQYLRWTDILAERLSVLPLEQRKAVANAGIAGNRIVSGGNGPPALERLDRDVLDLSGVSHVIFFEGTNDISGGATGAAVIEGMQKVLDRLRARNIKVIGVTMMPRGQQGAGFTALQEQYRLEINSWLRSSARLDGLIDFDAVTRGGGKSNTGAEIIKPEFNCDFTHPNTAGYAAMGNAIDLGLFRN